MLGLEICIPKIKNHFFIHQKNFIYIKTYNKDEQLHHFEREGGENHPFLQNIGYPE